MTDYEGREQAEKALLANTSPRYRRLAELEDWVTGEWYQKRGLCSWWDDSEPLWERAPCIVYPVVSIAIQSYVDLVLGESRWPVITSSPGEEEADEENGLGEDDSAKLDRFICEHHRICRFRAHARDVFAAALGCGTGVAIHGVRNGRPFADRVPAKWATPELDTEGRVLSLELRYPYLEEYQRPDRKWALRPKLYRRVIDDKRDVTFLPADAREDGIDPSWVEDPKRTVQHGLGFAPVIWYPLLKGCVPVNVIDGRAIHQHITDEIRQHDIAISERHRLALLSEGQIVEIGVEDGYNPTASGRTAEVFSTEKGGIASSDNPVNGSYRRAGGSKPARKKGPSYVWQYPSETTKVEWLSPPVEAIRAQDENVRDIRMKLMESLGVVLLDPESIKFASTTSGKALEAIRERQIDRCDQYRDDLREGFLLPSVDMQLRIAAKLGAGCCVPGIDEVSALLKKFDTPDAVAQSDAQPEMG